MTHTVLADTRHGPMLCNPHDQYVGRSLIDYGEFSPGERDLLCALVDPGQTVVDAGANIGALTIPLAQRVGPTGTVFAFEPQRFVFQALCGNVALNSLTNVHAHCAALGPERALVPVPVLDPSSPQNFGGVTLLTRWSQVEHIPCYALDDLKIPIVHLLKADVEGMEPEVLRGARQTIRRSESVLYLEADREVRRNDLIAELKVLEYVAFWHRPPLYSAENFRGSAVNLFPDIVSFNWLCVHRSMADHLPDTLQRVEGL